MITEKEELEPSKNKPFVGKRNKPKHIKRLFRRLKQQKNRERNA